MISKTINGYRWRLKASGISSAQLDAELLVAFVMGRPREWVLAHADEELTPGQKTKLAKLVLQRLKRKPMAQILGHKEFFGLDIEITKDVLQPRPETEKMVEWAIKYAPTDSKLLDMGTGSGAIAIAIAKHRPDLQIVASEVSPTALEVAQRNSDSHKTSITFIQSDMWKSISGRFSTIVTNLPYLKNDDELLPEVKNEPAIALFGGNDGLDLYRQFFAQVQDYLEPGGYVFTECDPWQQEALINEAAKVGLHPIEQDYFILGFQSQGSLLCKGLTFLEPSAYFAKSRFHII